MNNLTSYSCSATPISCRGDEISRLRVGLPRLVFEIFCGTDRQTDDRRQTRRPLHKALTLNSVRA